MRILTSPRIALKWITPNPEREIESAGRVCWESWGRSDGSLESAQGFIERLKKVGHIDVMEESEMSMWIECSRSCSHQLVRHRTFHFLQSSQRYVKANEPEFMMPPALRNNGEKTLFISAIQHAYDRYHILCEAGIRKEDARFLLPNATLTKIKAKANFANWRKFFELRSDQSAQWEIRAISNSVLEIAYEHAPSVFNDLYEKFILEPEKNGKQVLTADVVDLGDFQE